MDDTQMYTRSVACGPTGKIDTGFGYGRANVVAYELKGGLIWGLTSHGVFAVDPNSGEVTVKADAPVPIRCGFALRDDAVYFGSGAHLWRYRLA